MIGKAHNFISNDMYSMYSINSMYSIKIDVDQHLLNIASYKLQTID